MGVTYTTRRDRDRRRPWPGAGDTRGERLILATVIVALLTIAIGYAGRLGAFEVPEAEMRAGLPVNLSMVTSANALEPAMAAAFNTPADRRLAARELAAWLTGTGKPRQPANIGALAQIQVPVASMNNLPSGSVYVDRLRAARQTPASDGDEPASIPLFTAGELTALKPTLIVRTKEQHGGVVFWCAVAFAAAFLAISLVWRFRRMPGDRVLLSAACLLTSLGFVVMLSRPDPLRDTLLVLRYTQGVIAALAVFLVASMVNVRRASHLAFSYLPLAAAFLLSILLILFGSGPGTSGARINLGPGQPVEAIRLLLALFLAGYFARRWEVIRQVRGTEFRSRQLPAWLNAPRPDHILPVVVAVFLALVLFFALKDLGPALLLSLTFLSMFALARARVGMAAGGMAVLLAGFYLGHMLGISTTLSGRIAMWLSPWENAVRGGDQVAQAVWAMAAGALQGAGAGLGATRYVPAGHTDLVVAAIGEELGIVGILAVVAAFGVIVWRGFRIGRAAATDYGFFLAIGMTLSIVVPLLVMTAGVLGMIPLTGVVTPFLSYGGSGMIANFAALGLLVACGADVAPMRATEPFRAPLRWLGVSLSTCAVLLVVVWARVQIVSADELLVRPQLSRQGDGGLRYQYNPRILDAAQKMSRGTVFDRAGLPLATSDAGTVLAAAAGYERLGISIADMCPADTARCYPLGHETFHLLGDVDTRANWAASNTSYIERDAEDRLRGFDDKSVVVRTDEIDSSGGPALRRNYGALVPLVRHRWDPAHPDVRALLDRSRDVTLTIDARLQHRVSAILSRAAHAANVTRAAAVVLDAATGEVLASVSYPWPGNVRSGVVAPDAALDRARYGLYPPGSTFKLVTAAAALRTDPGLAALSLVCSRLPGDRVGARIPGVGRPVRDDVLDRKPHGAIGLHDGLVQSCNAYFAQLAMHLGADVMSETANLAGISLGAFEADGQLRANLPHAGYGQGQVVTSPLRMARVAAAIGSDGAIRETPMVMDTAPPLVTPFLSPGSARVLGGYMRDAVTQGSGRRLGQHPVPIAGKTGTAEVDAAASHAWFVGFAPHGAAARRIAFAVILENAGYGGSSAAAAAGEIVTAAASMGLTR